ncbi:histidine kinase dimerization/phospho-acceptor domain-containing protein [Paenibacillus rhizoplanae]
MREIQRSGKFRRLPLEAHSKDELVEMGHTFNEMIGLLESNYVKQEKFVSDASHELRTPLTVIESYASLLKRRGRDHPELFDESVEAIHSEAVRMKEMTEQLLLLAKHPEQWDLELKVMDLEALARSSAKAFFIMHTGERSRFRSRGRPKATAMKRSSGSCCSSSWTTPANTAMSR